MTEASERGREPSNRRPYESPQLGRIDLVTDEVLGTGCKSSDVWIKNVDDWCVGDVVCVLDGS